MDTKKRGKQVTPDKKTIRNLFPIYRACMNNAQDLLDEAELLYRNNFFQRAFFLALTSYEEIGKAQIVADYITDIVAKEEYEKAFKDHDLKYAYNRRFIQINQNGTSELIYNKSEIKEFVGKRMNALYVGVNKNQPKIPKNEISNDDAIEMIDIVKDYLYEIFHSEWLNQRIGTKGLFK